MVLDPKGRPIRKFVGEGHGKELIEFVQIAEELFMELALYDSGAKIELPPIAMGLKTQPSFLLYPGKIHTSKIGAWKLSLFFA